MSIVILDTFDVKVKDYIKGGELFEVKAAIDSNLSFDVEAGKGYLLLKGCYFNASLLDKVAEGVYANLRLNLTLTSEIKDTETGGKGKIEISAYDVRLEGVSFESTGNRIMTNNVTFKINSKSDGGKKGVFVHVKMDDVEDE
jgi:hypothetical protein